LSKYSHINHELLLAATTVIRVWCKGFAARCSS